MTGDGEAVPGGPRKGVRPWVWVLAGCGLVFVVGIGSCVGLGVWGVRKFQTSAGTEWEKLRRIVEQVATDEGARALYASAPALATAYPSEDLFVDATRTWRGWLGTSLPAEPPSMFSGRYQFQIDVN